MLKKKWVKTSATALIMGLSIFNAMAQEIQSSDLVKIQDFQYLDFRGTGDEICQQIVDDWNATSVRTISEYQGVFGLGYRRGSWSTEFGCRILMRYTDIDAEFLFKESDTMGQVQCLYMSDASGNPILDQNGELISGKIYSDFPEKGCAILRASFDSICDQARDNQLNNGTPLPEFCGEPPTEEQCAASREQLLINGTPLLEGCLEFPANDGLCQGQDSFIEDRTGTVACIPEDPKESAPCFWIDNFYYEKKDENERYYYANPQARQMIYQCMIEHEQVHQRQLIDDTVECRYFDANDEGYSPPFGRMGGVEYLMRPAERLGYLEEKRCLDRTKDQCGSDAQCQAEIEQRRDIVENNWRSNGGGSASS